MNSFIGNTLAKMKWLDIENILMWGGLILMFISTTVRHERSKNY